MIFHSCGCKEQTVRQACAFDRGNCSLYEHMCPLAQRTDNTGSFPSRWMAAHIFSLLSNMLKPRNLMKSFHVNLEVSFQLEVVNQG